MFIFLKRENLHRYYLGLNFSLFKGRVLSNTNKCDQYIVASIAYLFCVKVKPTKGRCWPVKGELEDGGIDS